MRTKPEKSQFTAVFQKAIAEAKKRKPRITKSDVARACGVKPPSVKKWADGISEPTLANLVKVADLLDCSTDYLLGRTQVNAPVSIQGNQNAANIVDSTVQIGGEAGDRFKAEVARLTRECERLSRECERLASRNA